MDGKGYGTEASKGRSKPVTMPPYEAYKGDSFKGTPLNDTPQKRIVTHNAAPGFTIGERAALRDATETDARHVRKLGMMDFNRSRQSVRAALLALPFLDAASRKAGTEGTGQGQHKGAEQGADFGASGAVGDRDTPPLSLLRPIPSSASHTVIPRHNTGSRNSPPLDLTPTERLTVQAAIETEIYTIRKASRADFEHCQKAILRQCLALPFLNADARRRLAAAPLPGKAETISELQELTLYLSR
jgi:hypothetical protein